MDRDPKDILTFSKDRDPKDILTSSKDRDPLDILTSSCEFIDLELKIVDLQKELDILQEEYTKLDKRYDDKQNIINNNLAVDMIDYLNECDSLEKTAEYFNYDVLELFTWIPEWDDCNDRLYGLDNYKYYLYKYSGRRYEMDDINDNSNELKIKMRILGKDELDKIFEEYKSNKLSLYELADKYNILINNLFRFLKDNKLIEKESDAIGYNDFYKEYIGDKEYNKYNTDNNLIFIDIKEQTEIGLEEKIELLNKKLNILKEEYNKLQKRCRIQHNCINKKLADSIVEYLDECNSLEKTAKYFYTSPEELYYCIEDFDGCLDRLYQVEDYNKYYYKINGKSSLLGLQSSKRLTPEKDELDLIFEEFINNKSTLYELADKYNLSIINLFRLLKEHQLIEKESDAVRYNEFYKEYIGEQRYNSHNVNNDLKLIEMYYKYINQ